MTHVPRKLISQSKQKQFSKPWITNGIFKSIKTKQGMYRTYFLSNNPVKITEYKKYAIKIASEPLSIPFAFIYNQSIANGIVPDVFKISRVTPIYKSGEVTDTGNYRPIATLSSRSFLLEYLQMIRIFSLLVVIQTRLNLQ